MCGKHAVWEVCDKIAHTNLKQTKRDMCHLMCSFSKNNHQNLYIILKVFPNTTKVNAMNSIHRGPPGGATCCHCMVR